MIRFRLFSVNDSDAGCAAIPLPSVGAAYVVKKIRIHKKPFKNRPQRRIRWGLPYHEGDSVSFFRLTAAMGRIAIISKNNFG